MSFASTQDDIYHLFKYTSKHAIKLAEYSFFETRATKNIMSIKWPKDKDFIAFEHHSCLLTQEDCEQSIKKIHQRNKSFFCGLPLVQRCRAKSAKNEQTDSFHKVMLDSIDKETMPVDELDAEDSDEDMVLTPV